jgi:lipopolysaccharide transport system permease protein
VQNALAYNPMVPIIDGYQRIFLQHLAPQWPSLAMPAVVTVVLLVLGFVFFMRRVGEMVDEL